VETTLFGSAFADAWRNGAEEYYLRKQRGTINEILVSDAQQVFKPGVVPDADVALPSAQAINALYDRDLAFFDNRLDQIAMASGVSMDSAEGLYDAGAAYLRLGELDRAEQAFDRAIQRDPDMADAYNAKGVIQTRRRNYDEALGLFRRALSLNPGDAGYRINVSLAYYLQGRTDEARRAYDEALEVNRDFAAAFDFLNRQQTAPGPAAGPAEPLQRLAANRAYQEGAAYLRLKALDRAEEAFDRALALDPENADALNGKGVVETRRRSYDRAIGLFNRALALQPDNAGYHVNLAIAYHLSGRKADAMAAYRQAAALDAAYAGYLEVLDSN
jgi:tetratricopeptide (TPR) repeat protein